jgi:3-oxoacyl-[acyl-carrier-protein] synthase-3
MMTQGPDHFSPATACIAHDRLKLGPQCLAFDVLLGCSAYVYGLWLVSQWVANGTCKRVLLLAGDTASVTSSPEDRSVALLFGDAGSATAIEYSPDAEDMAFVLGTDGSGWSSLMLPAGGFRLRPSPETAVMEEDDQGNRRSKNHVFMDGLDVFNFTLKRVPPLVHETLALKQWEPDRPDAYLFHQANGFMLHTLMKRLRLPTERVPMNIDRYGNTSMVSITLLLTDDCAERLMSGVPFSTIMASFGVGFSWAGAGITFCGVRTAHVVRV